jgi:hypothetical protein
MLLACGIALSHYCELKVVVVYSLNLFFGYLQSQRRRLEVVKGACPRTNKSALIAKKIRGWEGQLAPALPSRVQIGRAEQGVLPHLLLRVERMSQLLEPGAAALPKPNLLEMNSTSSGGGSRPSQPLIFFVMSAICYSGGKPPFPTSNLLRDELDFNCALHWIHSWWSMSNTRTKALQHKSPKNFLTMLHT